MFSYSEGLKAPRNVAVKLSELEIQNQTRKRLNEEKLSHISVFTIQDANLCIMTTNDRLIYATVMNLKCVYKSGE